MNIVVGEFKSTGPQEINIDLVTKKWNHLWWLAEWRDFDDADKTNWRLIKYLRKDSPITSIKTTISKEQAKELIKKLNMMGVNDTFRSSYSWRRKVDIEFLSEYRKNKYHKQKQI